MTKLSQQKLEELNKFYWSPIYFIKKMWGLEPQPLICAEEHEHKLNCFGAFEKGKHLTWHQYIILKAIEEDLKAKKPVRVSVFSGHGIGKFLKNEQLCGVVENGSIVFKEAKNIIVGDTILGKDKPTKVIGVFPQQKQKAFSVTFDDGTSVDVGGPHLWCVRGRNSRRTRQNTWEILTTEEILKQGVQRKNGISLSKQWKIPQQTVQGFSAYKHSYVIGIWYGDGHVGKSGYTKPDIFIADKIKTLDWNVRLVSEKERTIYGLIYELRKIGADTLEKNFLPPRFLDWDIESRKELLRGLMDTDGTVQGRNLEFGTIRPGLADDVLMLIRSLGGKGRIRIKEHPMFTYKGEKKVGQRYYRISFQTPFNPFSLPRKAEKWKKPQSRYLARWIKSIESIKEIDGVCFKVDAEDELFLVGKEFIVTHNSSLMSFLIHWFLFTRKHAQIGCTAPTSDQLYDVLWKEIALWQGKLPPGIKERFEWTTTHYRIAESPNTWWARARTAKKESPEAFAGLHGNYVLLLGDESSGVDDEIFRVGEGSLTNKDTIVVLMGNPTRTEGYFYETHFSDKANWRCFEFSSEDSPIVDPQFVDRITAKYGSQSDEFRFMVLGIPPRIDGMKDGWMPLISKEELEKAYTEDIGAFTKCKLGVDPSGPGSNQTAFVLRDAFRAKVVALEDKSNTKSIAERALTLMFHYKVKSQDVIVDAFGVGMNVTQEIALANGGRVMGINVGEMADDKERFSNKRAEFYWRFREWLIRGGKLVKHPGWSQLLTIRYKRTLNGKIQIMPKYDMIRAGYVSPDISDAAANTFFGDMENNVGGDQRRVLSNGEVAQMVNIYG